MNQITKKMAPRMKDVAEIAGVSIKTVSRVLNHEPHVQERLRRKVLEAVEELDYVPSHSARSLRSSKSYDINLICHNAVSTYVNTIQFGAVIACQELGYKLSISLLENLESKPITEIRDALESVMRGHRPDGVMLLAPYANNDKIGFVLRDMQVPVVRVGPVERPSEGVLVEIDDFQASIDVVQHLVELGHERIGFVHGSANQRSSQVRHSGFIVAMQNAGLSLDPDYYRPGDFDFQSGYDAGQHFLSLATPPTAVFCSNDDMAAGLVSAFIEAGKSIPEDLSVVGFDDADIATCMRPLLTTIRQPLRDLGSKAVHELVSFLNSGERGRGKHVVLEHELIVRDTTRIVREM